MQSAYDGNQSVRRARLQVTIYRDGMKARGPLSVLKVVLRCWMIWFKN